MVPPKYKFYVGKLDRYMRLSSNLGIDNAGEFVNESGKYSYGLGSLTKGASLLVNMQSLDSYNSVFFYDSSQKLISRISLAAYNNQIIIPPSNAKYWAIRFTTADANFALKRQTEFIYWVQSVNPHYKELNKKYSKENGQEFFRISLDGKINLFGQDYEQVSNSNLEDQFIFVIEKYSRTSAKWFEYYKGEFSKTDCKFDHAKKKCELKTSPIDDYNEVMNKYENTYDLIKLAPEITKINMHKRSLMQVYVRGANSVSNFFGGTYWEDDVNEAIDSHDDLVNKYYFAYLKAGNEFYVKNAKLSEVNGVYAGTNGHWDNWNGYTCYMGTDQIGVQANIYIKRNRDNTILYQSEKQWMFLEQNNCYIGREDIVMVNVNDSTDKFTIESPFVYHIYRRLLCDVDTVTDSDGVKNTYDLPAEDFVVDNRNYKKCIGLTGGLFFCTSRAVDEPTRYGANDYGQYFTNQFIPLSAGLERPLPISRNSWANASLWYVYDSFYSIWEERFRKQYTLKDSWSIAAVIKALLKQIDPTLKHEATAEYSRFLYDESTPFGFARFYVYLTQKTNILKGDYDQPAQKAEISLEELTKMLRDCFRCYWYIEDGKFKVEHVLFFINGGAYTTSANTQLDFTKLTDQFNKKLSSYFQSEIEYDKTDLAQRYEFNWMDDATELFGGVTLDVKSNYVQKDKVEEINASQFSADVDYMLFDPSAFSNDGFALLCPVEHQAETKITSLANTISGACIARNTGVITTAGIIAEYKCLKLYIESGSYKIITPGSGSQETMWKYTDSSYSIPERRIIGNLVEPNVIEIELTSGFYAFAWAASSATDDTVRISRLSTAFSLPIINVELIDENGDGYTAVVQNWYASWIYLTARFYMHDMPASSVCSNVLGDLYATVKKCMKQTIEFPIEEDLDELQLVKTDLGDGKIDEFSVNIETRQAKVKLTYSPR